MGMVGSPQYIASQSAEYSVIHGLRAAVEAIAEPTDDQLKAIAADPKSESKVPNQGRVICLTSARDNSSMQSLVDIFHTVIVQQNTLSKGRRDLLHIERCHLVLINMYPANMVSMVTDRESQEAKVRGKYNRKYTFRLYSRLAGIALSTLGNPLGHSGGYSQSAHPSHSAALRSGQYDRDGDPDEGRAKRQLEREL